MLVNKKVANVFMTFKCVQSVDFIDLIDDFIYI